MKQAREEVKPAKNGKHGALDVTPKSVAPPTPLQSPFAYLRRLTDEFERQLGAWGIEAPWLDRPFGSWLAPKETAEMLWSPAVEVINRDGMLVVRADVPGAKKEDLSIEVLDDRLVLKGERRSEEKEEREGFFRSERTYGSFYRTIPLPQGVEPDTARAELRDGVLEIKMKAPVEEPKGRKIDIAS